MEQEGTGASASPLRGGSQAQTAAQIRGSTLLMAGRVIAVVTNMVVQVMVVRYLSTADYGAFAYALSFATAARVFVTLGHGRTITRFFAVYEEQGDHDRLFGAILMELVIITSVGVAAFLGLWALQDAAVGVVLPDALTAQVLLIVVLLAPVEALDEVAEGLFAVFAQPRQVFLRRYVLTPVLKLAVVGLVAVSGLGVIVLAIGYVTVSAVGLMFYVPALIRAMRKRGLLQKFDLRSAKMPVREVFAFSVPLLSTDLVLVSMTTVSVVILGAVGGVTAVAAFRAIRPVAMLNSFVMRSFNLLFLPLAARLHARGDAEGLEEAYWRTAVWIAVLTFPAIAMTAVFAEPMTIALFGERYRGSAPYLTILAIGYYANAALGFNATILQVVGRLRYLVIVNTAAAATNVLLCMVLAPSHGALGVAIAGAVSLVLQNVLNQLGLRRAGVRVFPRTHLAPYMTIATLLGVLWVAARAVDAGLLTGIGLTAIASMVLFVSNRSALGVADIYPGLLALPGARHLLGSGSAARHDGQEGAT